MYQIDEAAQALLKQDVWFAFGFGSAFDNTAGPDSDIDIAVLPKHPANLDIRLKWILSFEKAFNKEPVDLTLLDSASPILGFEALKGKLLFCDSRDKLAEYASLTARYYEDEMMRIEQGWKYYRENSTHP